MSLSASLRAGRPPDIEPKFASVTMDPTLQFASKPVRYALEYWKSVCGDRAMPRREDLSPFAMRRFLQHINLVDILRDRHGCVTDFVVTLEGQHAHEVYGAVTRRKLEDALPPHLAQRWRNGFALVCQLAHPVRFCSGVEAGGKPWLAGEALMAPLGEHGIIDALYVAFATWPPRTPP